MTRLLDPKSRAILALIEERSITRASKELGMQQPGLTKLLSRIEEELGKKLFLRTKRGLVPTGFCERLGREIREVQDQWETRYAALLEEEDRIAGRFRVGCHPVLASVYLARPFTSLQEKHPALKLELALRRSFEVHQSVVSGELELGIVAHPIPHPELVMRSLGREQVALWARSPLSAGAVVYYNPEMIEIQKVIRSLTRFRCVPVPDYALIRHLILLAPDQGGILPSPMALQTGGLEMLSKPFHSTEIALIYRADLPKTRAFKTIAGELGKKFRPEHA